MNSVSCHNDSGGSRPQGNSSRHRVATVGGRASQPVPVSSRFTLDTDMASFTSTPSNPSYTDTECKEQCSGRENQHAPVFCDSIGDPVKVSSCPT